jgi:hypothetical protein
MSNFSRIGFRLNSPHNLSAIQPTNCSDFFNISNDVGRVKGRGPTLGLRSFVIEWRRAPPFHETVELGSATGAGIAAAIRGEPKW